MSPCTLSEGSSVVNRSIEMQVTENQKQEARRTDATRRINATLAKLVAVEGHDIVRQQLLEIIADATGYRFAMLSEMEEDERHLRVVAVYMPTQIVQGAENLLGFKVIGHRVVNDPTVVLQTPPTELFNHIYEWRPEIAKPISTAIEFLMGIRQIVSIRLHTGDYYLGAANFFATKHDTDLALLEYLCNNHLVYAIRLIQEQAAREHLQKLRTEELQREVQVRQHAEEAIRSLYTITADQALGFSEKVQSLLQMGCRRFGVPIGIFSHIVDDEYRIEEVHAPNMPLAQGDVFPIGSTYCQEVLRTNHPLSFEHAGGDTWAKHPCYELFHLEAYLGTAVQIAGQQGKYIYGTLSFSASEPRPTPFQASDHEFLNLMAQWIGGELERQQRTEQLQAYATQLEQTHHELAKAHNRALEVSRLKSEFLATMSHEIRTPMNGIIGMTELLTTTGLDERQQYYANVVLKETDHLLRIINDILDFSKMEAGGLTLGSEGFSPITVVESVAGILSSQATAKQLALMTYVAPDVPTVLYGDASRLRQILLNLVGNAIKFTEHGDVLVYLTLKSLAGESAQLYCKVVDSGIGIDDDKRESIFQPFTQVDGGVTRRHGGTGLGLAIANRLVELMGGELGVESEAGSGSTFWFTASFERPMPIREDALAPTNSLDGIRILVVDDHQAHAKIVESYLIGWGATVDHAEADHDAFRRLMRAVQNNEAYHLIVVEQSVPAVDGLVLGHRIKQIPILQSTKLMMLTAFDNTEQRAQANNIGFDAYLTKPLRQIDFHNAVLGCINGDPLPDALYTPSNGYAKSAQMSNEQTEVDDGTQSTLHESLP